MKQMIAVVLEMEEDNEKSSFSKQCSRNRRWTKPYLCRISVLGADLNIDMLAVNIETINVIKFVEALL